MTLTNIESDIRNVVLLSFDSLRSDYIAMATPEQTPFFCRVRNEGAFFKNAITQAPFTVPAHLSMLTGLYPAKTGVRDIQDRPSNEIPTIFTILRKQGFYTVSSSRTSVFRNMGLEQVDRHIRFRIRKLAKAIAEPACNRFFAFLHYWDTHTPYETRLPGINPLHILLNALRPLDRFNDIRFLRRFLEYLWLLRVKRIRAMVKQQGSNIIPSVKEGYKDAIIKADKYLGSILNLLESAGIADRTLLVLTGDHGDSFNEHDEINRAADQRYEHGQFLYDNIIKVPLIFFRPTKKLAGAFDEQVQQLDIIPTVLEALNVEYNGDLDGKALWDVCTGRATKPERRLAFSEVVRENLGVERRCVRSMSSKLIHDYKDNSFELFDLSTDPQEKSNLWPGDGYDEKSTLIARLEAFSEISTNVNTSYSEEDQEQVEKTLRQLGYID
jgi:arylsulfatase A-like enzyme